MDATQPSASQLAIGCGAMKTCLARVPRMWAKKEADAQEIARLKSRLRAALQATNNTGQMRQVLEGTLGRRREINFCRLWCDPKVDTSEQATISPARLFQPGLALPSLSWPFLALASCALRAVLCWQG